MCVSLRPGHFSSFYFIRLVSLSNIIVYISKYNKNVYSHLKQRMNPGKIDLWKSILVPQTSSYFVHVTSESRVHAAWKKNPKTTFVYKTIAVNPFCFFKQRELFCTFSRGRAVKFIMLTERYIVARRNLHVHVCTCIEGYSTIY